MNKLIAAVALSMLLAGCATVHHTCTPLDESIGGGTACAYDVAASQMPWSVQHRFAVIRGADGRVRYSVEDESSFATEIEAAIGPIGEAAKIVQPTAAVSP